MTHSWGMKPLDVVKKIRPNFITRSIRVMSNAHPLEHTQKAFSGSVVAAMPNGTQAADQRVAIQKAQVIDAGELTTLRPLLQSVDSLL